MDRSKKPTFELKKKSYAPPKLKSYGSFSDRTRGDGVGGATPDGTLYYTGQPVS